jgi:predicted phosphate transport protein (TIGR00153 family)
MAFKFLPKGFNFLELFEKQVDCAVESSRYFSLLVSKITLDDTYVKKMQELEHQGDEAAHAIIEHLNKTFITPFDREDIHELTKELDNITDMIYNIARRLAIYRFNEVNETLVNFASVIEKSVQEVASVVKGLNNLKNSKSIQESCVEINRLENVGDAMRDSALAELFDTIKDPILVIKWKEIYEFAETVLDICEDVANVVESILVKQA